MQCTASLFSGKEDRVVHPGTTTRRGPTTTMQGFGRAPHQAPLTIPRSRRRASRQAADFEIYCDPPEMSSENVAAVSEFIKGAPPGEVQWTGVTAAAAEKAKWSAAR